uniref:glutathione gamma-glutamylcysteinyltransferase n=1 Tax=Plectus sambesii TaxID=2011161 RepID=A0A914XMC2_9BILA
MNRSKQRAKDRLASIHDNDQATTAKEEREREDNRFLMNPSTIVSTDALPRSQTLAFLSAPFIQKNRRVLANRRASLALFTLSRGRLLASRVTCRRRRRISPSTTPELCSLLPTTIRPSVTTVRRSKMIYTEPELDSTPNKKKCSCNSASVLKFMFSEGGLAIVILLYIVGGGLLFRAIESSGEREAVTATYKKALEIENIKQELIEYFTTKSIEWKSLNFSMVIAEYDNELKTKYQDVIADAVQNYSYDGTVRDPAVHAYGWELFRFLSALCTAGILVCFAQSAAVIDWPDLSRRTGDDGCRTDPNVEPKSDEPVIHFSSSEGRMLLKRTLNSPYGESFYKLVQNYKTQEEKTFCGLSSLSMAITTLEVDTEYYGKPWEFQEKQLACCPTADVIRRQGITFSDFVCLASINGLFALGTHGNSTDGLQNFRQTIMAATSSKERVMAVNYNRRLLGFYHGHLSTIGAYDCATDRALIFEVQRYEFEPQWVKLSALYTALSDADTTSKEPRGYAVFARETTRRPTLLNQILVTFRSRQGSRDKEAVRKAVREWKRWLAEPVTSEQTLLEDAAQQLRTSMGALPFCCVTRNFCAVNQTGDDGDKCGRMDASLTESFCSTLLQTDTYKAISARSNRTMSEDQLLAALFIVWPYATTSQKPYREASVGRRVQSEWTNGTMQFWEMVKESRDQLAQIIQQYQ